MKKMLYCFLFTAFVGCNSVDKYAKDDLIGIMKIDNNLYKETYCIYRGGVYGGDTHTCYLTDSTSFRLYLGWQDDHERIKVVLMNDSIVLVYKSDMDRYIMTEKKEYNLYSLKREGKFE